MTRDSLVKWSNVAKQAGVKEHEIYPFLQGEKRLPPNQIKKMQSIIDKDYKKNTDLLTGKLPNKTK